MYTYIDLVCGIFEHLWARGIFERIPESEMIVETPKELDAYNNAMQQATRVYLLYFTELFSRVVNRAQNVLDIGCGSGDLLIMIAKANKHVHFTGTDDSEIALSIGREQALQAGVTNVTFVRSDMKNLLQFTDHTFDAVISRFTLHHLQNEAELKSTASAIERIAKPHANIWIIDFQRLRSKRLMRGISHRHKKRIGPLVSRLYYESLQAAFDFATFKKYFSQLPQSGDIELSSILPVYMGYYTNLGLLTKENRHYIQSLETDFSIRELGILLFLRCITWVRTLHIPQTKII